jgi:predicted  nucleic acid-binding Zn-ribbon protein
MATDVPALLRECHRLRKHLRDLKDEIERGPRVLKAQQSRLAAEEQEHKDAYDTIKRLKLQLKEDEGSLKVVELNLEKLATKAMTVTTMKEMEAVRHETEQAQAKKGQLEDSILGGMAEIEERTANLPKVELKWKEAQSEFAQYQIDAKERLERMLEDQTLSIAELAKRDAELPGDMKDQYDRLVKAHGPDGLAGVKGTVCGHCRSIVGESRIFELEAGKFVTCAVCGRGLYLIRE